jgi:hypothetical protein
MARICPGGELLRFFRRGGFAQKRYRSKRCAESGITPPKIPWHAHRIATSRHYHASLVEVQTQWSIDDVVDAHEALDYFASLENLELKKTGKGRLK